MRGTWSIRGRMVRWLAALGALIAVVIGSSYWFLGKAVDRELNSLVAEEIDEAHALFLASDRTKSAFSAIVNELAAHHPANPLAWRVWDTATGQLWGEFGSPELLAALPLSPGVDGALATRDNLRWCTGVFDPDRNQVVGLDGSTQLTLLHRFRLFLLGVAAVFALVTILGGTWFCRRVSNQLLQVAEHLRSIQAPEGEVDLELASAPEEIREVAGALSEMLRNIQRTTERAQLLTAGMAHELRSPIQNLLGESEVALLRDRESTEYRQVLESHQDELRDFGRAVDNLITLCSTPQANGQDLEAFDLRREADLRMEKEIVRAKRSGVGLTLEHEGDLRVDGDREALLLALQNLVSNAVAWSPEGGRVRVRLVGDDERVSITVDDEGPGVPDEDRERIFEPFYHAKTTNGRRVGYGLGLALTRSAVEAHNGRIDVERSPLGGARFRIELPRGVESPGHPLRG